MKTTINIIMYVLVFILSASLLFSCKKNNEKDNMDIKDGNSLENKAIYEKNIKQDFTIEEIKTNDFLRLFTESNFLSLDIMGEADYNWRWGIILRFSYNGNNNFAFIPDGPPYSPWVTGEYYIENGKVILNPTFFEKYDYIYDILKETWELEYISIEDSLFFTEGLTGKGIIFGARNNNRPQKGILRNVNGVNLILDNYILYMLDKDTFIRKGPGIDYESINYFDMGVLETFEYIPEGKNIYIIGRTEFQETHNNITGYWFYCQTIPESYERKSDFGWIFGLDHW